MRHAEITVSTLLVVIGVVLAGIVIPKETVVAEDIIMGPAVLPTACAVLIAALSAIRLVILLRAQPEAGSETESLNWQTAAVIGILILISIGLFWLINPLIAGIFFLLSSMWLMGERRPVVLVLTPGVLTVSVYLLFYRVLGTPFQ